MEKLWPEVAAIKEGFAWKASLDPRERSRESAASASSSGADRAASFGSSGGGGAAAAAAKRKYGRVWLVLHSSGAFRASDPTRGAVGEEDTWARLSWFVSEGCLAD